MPLHRHIGKETQHSKQSVFVNIVILFLTFQNLTIYKMKDEKTDLILLFYSLRQTI